MRAYFNPITVWSQTLVADRTVEVNTKAGFSLTAGSYVVTGAVQAGTITGVSLTATSASGTAQVKALPIISTAATRPTGQEGVSRPTLTVSDRTEIEQYYELAVDQGWSWMKVRVQGIFSSPADTQATMQLTLVPR